MLQVIPCNPHKLIHYRKADVVFCDDCGKEWTNNEKQEPDFTTYTTTPPGKAICDSSQPKENR